MSIEELEKKVEENLEYSRIIYDEIKKIKTYILWGRIMSLLQLLVIIIPIILGIIYLPSLVKDFVSSFSLAGASSEQSSDQGNIESFFEQYKQILELYK